MNFGKKMKKTKKQELYDIRLVLWGVLFGLIATGLYDLFKTLLTPILLEGRGLDYKETMGSYVTALAVILSVSVFCLLFYRAGFFKHD